MHVPEESVTEAFGSQRPEAAGMSQTSDKIEEEQKETKGPIEAYFKPEDIFWIYLTFQSPENL